VAAPARVLYVGLDACDAHLATRLAAEGAMPNLARLLDTARVTPTRAPTGFYVSAHWPTFFTSLSPDRHDYYCWKELRPGTYDDEITSPREIEGTPFWSELSTHGKRVAVIDVPHTLADPTLDGVQLVEWGCHDRHFGPHSRPAGLIADLDARFGPHPVGGLPSAFGDPQFAPCDYHHRAGPHRTADENRALWTDLVEGQRRKSDVSIHLLDQGGWDLFLTVLGESHCVGHQLWHLHDPGHPWYDPSLLTELGDPVVEMYRRLDTTLGEHVDRGDADTTTYVHLSHGMAAHYDGTHLLDALIDRIDLSFDGAGHGWRTRSARRAGDLLPAAARRRLSFAAAPFVRRRGRAAPPTPAVVERGRDQRRWFEVPNNTVVGGIRLNQVGREPAGRITADDADRWCGALTSALLDVVNVETGEPVIDSVVRFDDVYRPVDGHAFPDLLVEWNRNAPIEMAWSPRTGTVFGAYDHWRTGDHREHGLLLARGPGIVPGRTSSPLDTVDLGATLCSALGVVRPDVDGRPDPSLVPHATASEVAG
jgi:predicted AlkP superfamily phosphohydrolase/phosphomutase